jgi:hypothetical protein
LSFPNAPGWNFGKQAEGGNQEQLEGVEETPGKLISKT